MCIIGLLGSGLLFCFFLNSTSKELEAFGKTTVTCWCDIISGLLS